MHEAKNSLLCPHGKVFFLARPTPRVQECSEAPPSAVLTATPSQRTKPTKMPSSSSDQSDRLTDRASNRCKKIARCQRDPCKVPRPPIGSRRRRQIYVPTIRYGDIQRKRRENNQDILGGLSDDVGWDGKKKSKNNGTARRRRREEEGERILVRSVLAPSPSIVQIHKAPFLGAGSLSSPSSPPPLPSSSPLSLAFICLPIATECPGEEEASARRGEAEYEEGTTAAAVPLRFTPQLRWYVCTTCNSQGQTGLELGVVAPLPFFLSEDSSLFHFSITLFDFPHDSWAHACPPSGQS